MADIPDRQFTPSNEDERAAFNMAVALAESFAAAAWKLSEMPPFTPPKGVKSEHHAKLARYAAQTWASEAATPGERQAALKLSIEAWKKLKGTASLEHAFIDALGFAMLRCAKEPEEERATAAAATLAQLKTLHPEARRIDLDTFIEAVRAAAIRGRRPGAGDKWRILGEMIAAAVPSWLAGFKGEDARTDEIARRAPGLAKRFQKSRR